MSIHCYLEQQILQRTQLNIGLRPFNLPVLGNIRCIRNGQVWGQSVNAVVFLIELSTPNDSISA